MFQEAGYYVEFYGLPTFILQNAFKGLSCSSSFLKKIKFVCLQPHREVTLSGLQYHCTKLP